MLKFHLTWYKLIADNVAMWLLGLVCLANFRQTLETILLKGRGAGQGTPGFAARRALARRAPRRSKPRRATEKPRRLKPRAFPAAGKPRPGKRAAGSGGRRRFGVRGLVKSHLGCLLTALSTLRGGGSFFKLSISVAFLPILLNLIDIDLKIFIQQRLQE